MKTISIKRFCLLSFAAFVFLFIATSCEQDKVEPELNTAPGGGTLSAFKAYTLAATDAQDIHGRIVFWKDNADNTLVQISLYNTIETDFYPSGIFDGESDEASETELVSLYAVNGATGEFSTSKFFVINDKTFYDELDSFDAHVQVFLGDDAIAIGDVGVNATPVDEDE